MPKYVSDHHENMILLGKIMRLIRKQRRLAAVEVARRMDIPKTSYENLETGTGHFSIECIRDFAKATDCDPMAIVMALCFANPDMALHCMDNNLMMIVMTAMNKLDKAKGYALQPLPRETIITSVERICDDITTQLDKLDLSSEAWLERNYYGEMPRSDKTTAHTKPKRA